MKAKNESAPIEISEAIVKTILEKADFSFEMRILKLARQYGCLCTHSGSYIDRTTGKSRQYDIRAKLRADFQGLNRTLFLGIETKNLSSRMPLVIHEVKRRFEEATNDVIQVAGISRTDFRSETLSAAKGSGRYYRDGWVGKSMNRIVENKPNEFKVGEDAHEKMMQAVASCKAMQSNLDERFISGKYAYVPVLVVPDGALWVVRYDDDGSVVEGPMISKDCSYYIDEPSEYRANRVSAVERPFRFTHLEICTESHFKALLENLKKGSYPDYLFNIFGDSTL